MGILDEFEMLAKVNKIVIIARWGRLAEQTIKLLLLKSLISQATTSQKLFAGSKLHKIRDSQQAMKTPPYPSFRS